MKKFKNMTEAEEYARNNLGKMETETVKIGGDKVLACGTPMVEDIIDNEIAELLARVTEKLTGVKPDAGEVYCDNDIINPIQDAVWDAVLELSGHTKYIFGSIDY